MIETFQALAEPNRFRIVELLRAGPRSVGAIVERLGLNQPQVSKHLNHLKKAHLVEVEPRAQQRLYGLSARGLRDINVWLERYRAVWDERFTQLDDVIADIKRKPKKS